MARVTCESAIEEIFGSKEDAKINAKERDKMVKLLRDYKLKNFKDDPEGFTKFAQDSLNRYRTAVEKQRLSKVKTILTVERELSRFRSEPKFQENPVEFLRGIMTGTEGSAKGANDSIELTKRTLSGAFTSRMHVELERAGLSDSFYKGLMDKEVFKAYHDLTVKGVKADTPEGKIAQILHSVDNAIVSAKKQYGSNMEALDGHLVKQMHDSQKIYAAGFDAWSADVKRVFKSSLEDFDPKEADDYLKELYTKIINNDFQRDFGSPEFTEIGSSKILDSLDKRMSKQRFFRYDDPELAHDYFTKYSGKDNLASAFMGKINMSARDISVLKSLGGSPASTYKSIVANIANEIKDNPKALDSLRSNEKYLETLYDNTVRGERRPVENIQYGMTKLSSVVDAVHLGSASVTAAFTDVPLSAMAMKSATGESFLGSIFSNISQFSKNAMLSKAEKSELYKELGQSMDIYIRDTMERFGGDNYASKPGMFARSVTTMLKMSGLSKQTTAATASGAALMSKRLAQLSDQAFDSNPILKQTFERHNISPIDWELMKNAKRDIGGDMRITPESIRDLPDDLVQKTYDSLEVKDLTRYRNAKEYRSDLALKTGNLLNDIAEAGIKKAGAYEKTILYAGHGPDTSRGMLYRMAFRFMSFPTAMSRAIRRTAFTGKEGMSSADFLNVKDYGSNIDLMNLSQFMLSMTMAGYMSKSFKDLAAGKELMDPTEHPEVIADAFIAGGAAGLYTDIFAMMFQEGYGKSALAALGPMGSRFDSLGDLMMSMKDGKQGSTSGKLFRLLYKNTPGNNLFYTKLATDQLIYFNILNEIDPGYMRRFKQSEKKRGVERWIDI